MDEVFGELEQLAASGEPAALRDLVIIELLYATGCRVSELAGLDLDDIDSSRRLVKVTGKGNKQRTVPVGGAALEALKAWLAARPAVQAAPQAPSEGKARASIGPDDEHALFLSARGRRITPRAVQSRIKAHAQSLGIAADVHPHVLRHSFASHVLQSSGDLRAVQELLGHASIASTQVYTALDFQRLAQVYDAAHPRAKKQDERD